MGNPSDWTDDQCRRLYYGGTIPEAYRDDAPIDRPACAEDEAPAGHEAAPSASPYAAF